MKTTQKMTLIQAIDQISQETTCVLEKKLEENKKGMLAESETYGISGTVQFSITTDANGNYNGSYSKYIPVNLNCIAEILSPPSPSDLSVSNCIITDNGEVVCKQPTVKVNEPIKFKINGTIWKKSQIEVSGNTNKKNTEITIQISYSS